MLLYVPFMVWAQTDKVYLIKTGRLFDSEVAQFKTGLDIIVKNGRIDDVKADKDIPTAEREKYTLIDLSAFTILPGLIDVHTHLLYKEELLPNRDFSSESLVKRLTMEGDAYRAIYGAVRAKAYLEAGITSVQDLGNSGKFADIALRKAINENLVPGPRMSCAGQGLASEGGQLPGLIYEHRDIANDEYRIVSGVDDARQAVRENITQGANVIKIYSNNTPNKTALSVEEMSAIVKEAHRYGVRVTAHATDDHAVYNAVISGVDGIEHGYEIADSTLMLMAKKKVILVPTDLDKVTFTNYLKIAAPNVKDVDAQITKYQKSPTDRLQRAIKFGVTIAYGSDDYIDMKMPLAEPSKRILIAYHEEGVAIPQVLQFATLNSARQINHSALLGVIKKSYLADIIAVDNSIDKDINAILNVRFVMKGGVIYVNKQ
ncbi:MAG: amidohydrolase [Mucilaginibacter sp.]|nr:amidohydrolase [Mucilaginibacter sp.]